MPAPVSRPRSSPGTVTMATSITTCSECLTEECVSSVTSTDQRAGGPSGRVLRAVSRAATRADRLPIVPPCTNTPPAPSGRPASSAIQLSAWFSA